jgi:hypothetical protein
MSLTIDNCMGCPDVTFVVLFASGHGRLLSRQSVENLLSCLWYLLPFLYPEFVGGVGNVFKYSESDIGQAGSGPG